MQFVRGVLSIVALAVGLWMAKEFLVRYGDQIERARAHGGQGEEYWWG